MELRLQHPRDAAELVLNRPGDPRQSVGFQLRKRDQPVRVERAIGDRELLDQPPLRESDAASMGEVRIRNPECVSDVREARSSGRRAKWAEARRVPVTERCSRLRESLGHSLEDHRVRVHGPAGRATDEEVRLEYDLLSGTGELPHTSEQIESPPDPCPNEIEIVGITSHQCNATLRSFTHHATSSNEQARRRAAARPRG